LKATQPASFFIRIVVKCHDHCKDVYLKNCQTKEKLVIRSIPPIHHDDQCYVCLDDGQKLMVRVDTPKGGIMFNDYDDKLLLISRHSMDVTNAWIAQNQKELLDWNFDKMGRQIRLNRSLGIGMEMTRDN
jgi:hypothetical protein